MSEVHLVYLKSLKMFNSHVACVSDADVVLPERDHPLLKWICLNISQRLKQVKVYFIMRIKESEIKIFISSSFKSSHSFRGAHVVSSRRRSDTCVKKTLVTVEVLIHLHYSSKVIDYRL